MYNLTNVTDANTLPDITTELFKASGGSLGGILLLFIFFLILFVFVRFDFRARIILGGFATSMLGLFMFNLKWIGWEILIAPILILMAGVIMYMFTD